MIYCTYYNVVCFPFSTLQFGYSIQNKGHKGLLFICELKYVTYSLCNRPLKWVMNQKMFFCLSTHIGEGGTTASDTSVVAFQHRGPVICYDHIVIQTP